MSREELKNNQGEKVSGGMPTEYHCERSVGKYYEDLSFSALLGKTEEPCPKFKAAPWAIDHVTGIQRSGCQNCVYYKEGK